MGLNIISKKSGWFLSEITGRINSLKRIVIANKESLISHKIKPGSYIRLKSLNNNQDYEKFIILPYQKDMSKIQNYLITLLKEFSKHKPFYGIDKNYLKDINQLVEFLYETDKSLNFQELLIDIEKKKQSDNLKIGVPDFWLMKNGLRLGEQVFLRNDHPSPIII